MGKKQPASLAVPFHLYDPKTLRVEEGPAPGHLTFGIGVDPLNPDAIKRKKADLPMLDVYIADAADGAVKAAGAGVHATSGDLACQGPDAGRAQALQELLPRRR